MKLLLFPDEIFGGNTPNTTPSPTQRVEQNAAIDDERDPTHDLVEKRLALQLATELEAAQKDLEMRAIRDDGQCDLIANLRQQLADKTRARVDAGV